MTFTQSDFSFSLCNEVLLPMSFEQQCRYAADLGYKGLEVAPFTMSEHPESITTTQAQEWRRIAQDHGLHITGLHWLLVAPTGLSITDPDVAVRQRTRDFVRHLCECCSELGGRYLVHGSPRQREPVSGQGVEQAIQVASEFFADIAPCAQEHGLVYCIEPLSPDQTAVINTLAQAIAIIEQVGHGSLKTMLDTSSAARSEGMGIPELIDTYWPSGHLAHVQLNDPNRHAPGQGELRFGPILQALRRNQYAGAIAIEPFVYEPDGPGCAAFALGHLSALS